MKKEEENEAELGEDASQEQNEVWIAGRCVVKPKIRTVTGGAKMARFILAVRRKSKTAFVPVVAWRALAEGCEPLDVGAAMRVEGHLRTWRGEDKISRWEVEANVLQLLKAKPAGVPADETQQELVAA